MRLIALLLIMMAAIRWFPHPWNVSPNMALAIVAGMYLKGSARYLVPILVILIGDIGLAFTNGYGLANFEITPLSIATAAAIVCASTVAKNSLPKAAVLSIGGTSLFFILSNFLVWYSSNMYPHTREGLELCFTLAMPFYRNALVGDLAFTVAMVGIIQYQALGDLRRAEAIAK